MAFTKNIYSFSLDIKRKTGTRVLSVEGDTANQFIVFLTDDGKPIDLTGLYVRAVFRRSDGRTILQSESDEDGPVTKVAESGKVIIPVKNSAYRDGDNYMEIQILDGDPDSGDVLSTSAYMLIRARNCLLTDEATIGSVEFPVLQGLIDALRDIHVIINIVEPNVPASGSMVLEDGVYTLTLNIPKQSNTISIIEYGETTYDHIASEYQKNRLPVCYEFLETGEVHLYYLAYIDREEQIAKFTVVDPDGESISVVTAAYDEEEYGYTRWEKITKSVGDEVLIARYNVTTSYEIYEAFTEGKLVVCRRSLNNGEAHLGLLWSCDFSGATFYAPNAYGIWKYTVALSQWSESQHATGTFIAEYGVTTFAEIRDAYLADMPVYCNYQNRIYFLTRENLQSEQAGTFVFSRNEYISAAMLTCMGSSGGTTWASAAGSLQPALTAGTNITIETIPSDYDPETNVTTYHGQRISASGGGGPSLPVGSDDVKVENLIESVLTRIDDGDTLTFAIAQINALIDAIGDKLDDDGDANDVTVQRNATYSFADIPSTAIRLQELVDRLAGWYSEINSKQHALTAGTGISISNNIISATGGADIYIATPYTTPFVDIKTAWTAGKVVMCKYGAQGTHNAWYILTDLTESTAASAAMFTAVTSAGNLLTLKALESNGTTTWTNSSVTYRSAADQDAIDATKADKPFTVAFTQGANETWSMTTSYADWTAAKNAGRELWLSLTFANASTVLVKTYLGQMTFAGVTYAAFGTTLPALTAGNLSTMSGNFVFFAFADDTQMYNTTVFKSVVMARESDLAAKQDKGSVTTLTIAASDWINGSCTKTVPGMTADALGWVKYSDTETEFTETQGTNSLTFTADPVPSEAVTVMVGWFTNVEVVS